MTGGLRFLALLALVAALLCTFAVGFSWATLENAGEQRYQPYRYAPDKPLEVDPAAAGRPDAKALEYRAPCENPKGHEESDLCAQWIAAKAADTSAYWARWAFGAALVSAIGLVWQIGLTRMAVEDTGDATKAMEEANEIAREDTRPIFAFAGLGFEPHGGHANNQLVHFLWQNVGKRPARLLKLDIGRIETAVGTRPKFPDVLNQFESLKHDSAGLIIMPEGTHQSTGIMVSDHHFQIGYPPERHDVFLLARATYTNAIAGEHEREFSTALAVQMLPILKMPKPPGLPADYPWDEEQVLFAGAIAHPVVGFDMRSIDDPASVQMT